MLQVVVNPGGLEYYNESKEEFVNVPETILVLEHSLATISKWEARVKRAYASPKKMTDHEFLEYVKCMTVFPDHVDPVVYALLSEDNKRDIIQYMNDPMTATKLPEDKDTGGGINSFTAEQIYYWMIECGIPFECEHWHYNRLLMLIRVCKRNNAPTKKKSMNQIMKRNAELNALHTQQMKNSRG